MPVALRWIMLHTHESDGVFEVQKPMQVFLKIWVNDAAVGPSPNRFSRASLDRLRTDRLRHPPLPDVVVPECHCLQRPAWRFALVNSGLYMLTGLYRISSRVETFADCNRENNVRSRPTLVADCEEICVSRCPGLVPQKLTSARRRAALVGSFSCLGPE